MNKSPGHQRWPNHKVEEEHVGQPMKVEVNGETIAESNDVIRVKEDDHPIRYYFPRNDVRMTWASRFRDGQTSVDESRLWQTRAAKMKI